MCFMLAKVKQILALTDKYILYIHVASMEPIFGLHNQNLHLTNNSYKITKTYLKCPYRQMSFRFSETKGCRLHCKSLYFIHY